jgi:regulator of protease activity HflC (stomatin/prohibitin superfamily)
MKADPLAYKRAAGVSLIGLAIQASLAILLLLYAVLGQDAVAMTAFYYALVGVPAWVSLALVFHQHRLERVEAAEEEMYASSHAADASVFEGAAADFRIAASRLAWMHRVLIPVVGLSMGGLLVGLGLWRLSGGRAALRPDDFVRPEMTGWAVAIGLGVAVVGFIFARFVAGMAKQDAWSTLRAGAATSVGVSLAGLALATAHGVAFAGSEIVLRYMHVILPVMMVVLGAEIFLNFVLNVYRPRRAGEAPRPAFDSRILGFVAAPDRIAESINEAINYQFGFDVSSTWFYQLLSRSILSLGALAALILWGLTSLAVVAPNERGLVLSFGAISREVGSGLHWKAPWPFQTLETYPALTVNEFTVGTPKPEGDGPIIWTEPHGGLERFLLVQSSGAASATQGDLSMLAVETPVQYEVVDLASYKRLAADSPDPDDRDGMRRELLRVVAERELIEFMGSRSVDEILGAGRASMTGDLRRRIEARYATLNQGEGAGVRILFIGVAGAHPPRNEEVALSFERVVSAEQTAQASIENARADAIRALAKVAGDVELARRIVTALDDLERARSGGAGAEELAEREASIDTLLAEAGGQAAERIADAKADRWVRHMDVRATATRQAGRNALYEAAPAYYMASLYLDTISEAVRNARVFITAFDAPHIRLNFEEIQSNISGFNINSATQE